MKWLKRILKVFLILVLLLMITIAGTGWYVFRHPKETWALIEQKFLPKDLKITWQDLRLHFPKTGERQWSPEIEFENLCFQKQEPWLEFCADRWWVQSRILLQEIRKPQIQILNFDLVSQHENFFRPSKESKPEKKDEQNFYEMVETWQKRLKRYSSFLVVHAVNLDVKQFEIRSWQGPAMKIAASLQSSALLEEAQIQFRLEKKASMEFAMQAELRARTWLDGKPEEALNLKAKGQIAKAQFDISSLQAGWKSDELLQAQSQAVIKVSNLTVPLRLQAELSAKDLVLETRSEIKGLKKPFHSLKPILATVRMPMEKAKLWAKKRTTFEAKSFAPLFFVSPHLRSRLEKTCHCEIPEELSARAWGDADVRQFLSSEEGDFANVKIHIQNLNNSLLQTRIGADALVSKRNGEFEIAPQIDAVLKLVSFQGLSLLLKEYQFGMPAPFAELDGTITAKVQGPAEKSFDQWNIPFAVDVDLKSDQQKVDVASTGKAGFDPQKLWADVDVDVLLKNVALQLPPLDPVFGIPKVTPDKRFEVKPPAKVAKSKKKSVKLNLALKVHTQSQDSVRLLYPLADPWIPIGLNLQYRSGSPLQGEISLSPFKVEYLRRRMNVESFQTALNEPNGNFPVKGRFRIDQALYKIYVDVLGSLKKPQVVLSSDPYLDRSDIISVLLYGRPNDQLVSADAKTVGSFDAAVADRAIGLLGLWALSSTPIQSFSYNQLNQQFSAQLKISDDTSLAVGTNWEQSTSLELQKRLSDRWMISAAVEPTEEEQQSRKLRLQWEDRF